MMSNKVEFDPPVVPDLYIMPSDDNAVKVDLFGKVSLGSTRLDEIIASERAQVSIGKVDVKPLIEGSYANGHDGDVLNHCRKRYLGY